MNIDTAKRNDADLDEDIPVVDDSGFENEDESPEILVPFDPTKIDIVDKRMSISSLLDRLKNDELVLTPDFQRRANLWNELRKCRLIESVLLRIPLPSFYFSEDEEGRFLVVDGLQRLCAIFHFIAVRELNRTTKADLLPLRLSGLQYLKDLNNQTFDGFDRKFQRRLSELEITANIIRSSTPSSVKFNVFARLNQGGMPLTPQEIRNAIFIGNWRDRVRGLADSQTFRKATDGKVKKDRQQDMEIVLRVLALLSLGKPNRRPSNQNLDDFLNETVSATFQSWTEEKWSTASAAFQRGLVASMQVFGRHAFRKSVPGRHRRPINRGLFEAQMITLSELNDQELRLLEHRREDMAKALERLLDFDDEFGTALLYATGSAEASNKRIETLRTAIQGVLNAQQH